MNEFNFLTYFKDEIAVKHPSILHTESSPGFLRIASVFELTDFLNKMRELVGFKLLCVDQEQGKLVDLDSDNILSGRFFSFYLLHPVKLNDLDDKQIVLSNCKALLIQILSKILYDKRNNNFGVRYLDMNTITFAQVGPFGHSWFGYTCSFTVNEPTPLIHLPLDWYIAPPEQIIITPWEPPPIDPLIRL